MECTLVMFKSDGTRKDIPLVGPRSVVGRMSSCEVRIPLNSVSREHCELLCDGQTLRYKDLNSSNGVIHNGAKSKQGVLNAGDEMVIGPVVFTVMIDGKPSKIRPVRTILDEADDKAFARASDGSRADTTLAAPSLPAAAVVAAVAVAKAPLPLPPQPSREIGSSGEQVDVLKIGGDFEEFNIPEVPSVKSAGRPAAIVPSLPDPIGDDDDDDVAPIPPVVAARPAQPAPAQAAAKDDLTSAPSGDSSGFDLAEEVHGDDDDEEPAFTFE